MGSWWACCLDAKSSNSSVTHGLEPASSGHRSFPVRIFWVVAISSSLHQPRSSPADYRWEFLLLSPGKPPRLLLLMLLSQLSGPLQLLRTAAHQLSCPDSRGNTGVAVTSSNDESENQWSRQLCPTPQPSWTNPSDSPASWKIFHKSPGVKKSTFSLPEWLYTAKFSLT